MREGTFPRPDNLWSYLDADTFREVFASRAVQNGCMSRIVQFKVVKEGASFFAVLIVGFSRQELRSGPMASKGDAFAVCELVWADLHAPPDGPIGYTPDSLLPD